MISQLYITNSEKKRCISRCLVIMPIVSLGVKRVTGKFKRYIKLDPVNFMNLNLLIEFTSSKRYSKHGMERILNEIQITYTDTEINNMIKSAEDRQGKFSKHYNQSEEFFIKLDKEISIPNLPVHHDIKSIKPSDIYLKGIRQVVSQLTALIPKIFTNLIYFFDPGEILRPCFFQIFRIGEKQYLYLLRLDLSFRMHNAVMLDKGTNNLTPAYKSRNLFMEADFIPLEKVKTSNGKITSFAIRQLISQTWIGETGRGYFIQGIWIDLELSKYFSKLFIPEGKRSYPYFPFTCKYRTVSHSTLELDLEGRKKHLPYLVKAINFLEPRLHAIEKSLKNTTFTLQNALFQQQKKEVPPGWENVWENLHVKPYLNSKDMKEYSVDN